MLGRLKWQESDKKHYRRMYILYSSFPVRVKNCVSPREIAEIFLWPDLVMWSKACKMVLPIELTIPWEAGFEGAHKKKLSKYSDLVAEYREAGCNALVCPVEVGALSPSQAHIFSTNWAAQEQDTEELPRNWQKKQREPASGCVWEESTRSGDQTTCRAPAEIGRGGFWPSLHHQEMYWG